MSPSDALTVTGTVAQIIVLVGHVATISIILGVMLGVLLVDALRYCVDWLREWHISKSSAVPWASDHVDPEPLIDCLEELRSFFVLLPENINQANMDQCSNLIESALESSAAWNARPLAPSQTVGVPS